MAIDFPISPINGQTYDYGGVRFTFDNTGGAPGYWKVIEPGLAGPASAIEINAGTIPGKFIAPDALDASEYTRGVDIQANSGPVYTIGKSDTLDVSVSGTGAGALIPAASALGVNLNLQAAGVGVEGVVGLLDSISSSSLLKAPTANACKVAYEAGRTSGWIDRTASTNGRVVLHSGHSDATPIMVQWGAVSMAGNWFGAVNFPVAFTSVFTAFVGHADDEFRTAAASFGALTTTKLDWRVADVASADAWGVVTWLAIGTTVAYP